MPAAIKKRLKKYLEELEETGVVSKYEKPKTWVSSLVIREKPNGSLRICLDPKNLNSAIQRSYDEIPTTDSIATKMAGKKWFTVLDLKDGYWQVKLDEKSSELCAFSSPFGCYKFNRLPFGLSCAAEIFQKKNEENFGDLPRVIIYFDDILVTGETPEEHDRNLQAVMVRAREKKVKFNKNKIQYRKDEVTYVGYLFSEKGKQIAPDRTEAISALKDPTNIKESQRILGMINYIRDFIPNLATEAAPLRELLKGKMSCAWLPRHSEVLKAIKNKITKAPILQTFNENKERKIQTDASSTGVGNCLLQENKPVAFASRSLTEAEQNYSQTEKELLSVVFATKKFHNYIYGRNTTILTDHKPLVPIGTKEILKIGSSRLQRLKLRLMIYSLNIKYLPGKYMYIADLLSRDYLPCENGDEVDLRQTVHSISKHLEISAEKRNKLEKKTSEDEQLKQVKKYCKTSWPKERKSVMENMEVYWNQRDNMCTEDELVVKGDNVVIPVSMRAEKLTKLHEGHIGATKMKARAQGIMY